MSAEMSYSVTVTDWTQRRGYRNSGRGWRVRCFGLPEGNWNATGRTVFEDFYRSRDVALKKARELAKTWNATLMDD